MKYRNCYVLVKHQSIVHTTTDFRVCSVLKCHYKAVSENARDQNQNFGYAYSLVDYGSFNVGQCRPNSL